MKISPVFLKQCFHFPTISDTPYTESCWSDRPFPASVDVLIWFLNTVSAYSGSLDSIDFFILLSLIDVLGENDVGLYECQVNGVNYHVFLNSK